jgi:hypothetical protein
MTGQGAFSFLKLRDIAWVYWTLDWPRQTTQQTTNEPQRGKSAAAAAAAATAKRCDDRALHYIYISVRCIRIMEPAATASLGFGAI